MTSDRPFSSPGKASYNIPTAYRNTLFPDTKDQQQTCLSTSSLSKRLFAKIAKATQETPEPIPSTVLPSIEEQGYLINNLDIEDSDRELEPYTTPSQSREPSPALPMSAEQMETLLKQMSELQKQMVTMQKENENLKALQDSNRTVRESSTTSNPRGTKRSAKVSHPDQLENGRTPIHFSDWKIGIKDVLRINWDHYETEDAKMYLVYSLTKPNGLARTTLKARYSSDGHDKFKTHDEMLELLSTSFKDHNEQRRAKVKYDAMRQGSNPDEDAEGKAYDSFDSFKADFVITATLAKIAKSAWFDDIYDKAYPYLQEAIVPMLISIDEDFDKLCQHLSKTELELSRVRQNKAELKFLNEAKKLARVPKVRDHRDEKTSGNQERGASKPFPPKTKDLDLPKHFTPIVSVGKSTITCFNCGKPGHYSSDCTEPKVEKASINQFGGGLEEELRSIENVEDSENSDA